MVIASLANLTMKGSIPFTFIMPSPRKEEMFSVVNVNGNWSPKSQVLPGFIGTVGTLFNVISMD